MDYSLIFAVIGFLLASYSVVANDAVQTLETFIALAFLIHVVLEPSQT